MYPTLFLCQWNTLYGLKETQQCGTWIAHNPYIASDCMSSCIKTVKDLLVEIEATI